MCVYQCGVCEQCLCQILQKISEVSGIVGIRWICIIFISSILGLSIVCIKDEVYNKRLRAWRTNSRGWSDRKVDLFMWDIITSASSLTYLMCCNRKLWTNSWRIQIWLQWLALTRGESSSLKQSQSVQVSGYYVCYFCVTVLQFFFMDSFSIWLHMVIAVVSCLGLNLTLYAGTQLAVNVNALFAVNDFFFF